MTPPVLLLAAMVATATPQSPAGPAPVAAPDWTPCALADTDTERSAECALVQLPLNHDDPDGTTIGIAVKRVMAPTGQAAPRTQLWFLDGGPGDSGIHSLPRVHGLLEEAGVDLYTLDHRGVGQSAVLSCPDQEADGSAGGREILREEWPACMQYLREARPDLPYLTTAGASRDLASLIAATRAQGNRVIVLGASYGTYWAQRYLELFPEQPDAVILDGLVPPGWTFAGFDANIDDLAHRLMSTCAADPSCSNRFDPDVLTVTARLPERFDQGHCADLGGIDGDTVRLLLGNMLMAGQDIWPYIPPMVYRMNRCRLRDMVAIGELFEQLFEESGAGEEDPSHSPVLQRHVALSELWPDPAPAPDDLEAALQSTLMTTAVSAHFAQTWADWPRYPRPDDLAAFSYQGPTLFMHGDLDPTMPPSSLTPLTGQLSGLWQHFVLLPGVGHVTLGKSDCANGIYRQFIADPAQPLDLSCVAGLTSEPLRMPDDAPLLFGTADVWGDRLSELEILLLLAGLAVLAVVVGVIWFWRRRRARRG